MDFGDRRLVMDIECDAGRGLDGVRDKPSVGELRAESHGEAAGVSGGDEFFGICADAAFETCGEAVLRVLQDAALGGNLAFTFLEAAVPYGAGGRGSSRSASVA